MWSDRTPASELRLPSIRAAGAQFEAARVRQERLVARGQISRVAIDRDDPGVRLPGYLIERELHRGGQGVVFLAVQTSTGRQVAIKVLHFALRSDAANAGLARFER